MRTTLLSLSLLAVAFAAACKSTCCESCTETQTVVERIAKENPGVTRLTVHCQPASGAAATACASTAADKVGKASDPEDVKAMKTGETIVLEEQGALDVTVPILAKDGKCAMACGVTLKNDGGSREQLVAKATTIAKAVEAGLTTCCAMGGCTCK
jgi:hypothetical protein